jgi:hypothetical protein
MFDWRQQHRCFEQSNSKATREIDYVDHRHRHDHDYHSDDDDEHHSDDDNDDDDNDDNGDHSTDGSWTFSSIVKMRRRAGRSREFQVNWRTMYTTKLPSAHYLKLHRGRATRVKTRPCDKGKGIGKGQHLWRIRFTPSWEPLENLPKEAVCEYYEKHWTGDPEY